MKIIYHWLNVKDGIKGTRLYLNTKPNPYKTCPAYIIPTWSAFEQSVGQYISQLKGVAPITKPTIEQMVKQSPSKSSVYKIICDELNVRDIAGFNSKIITTVHKNEAYTILETKTVDGVVWGKLKSGVGWISLGTKYVQKIR